ncbi:MAG TPA: right-handed parallel beta-helix repeat-containing protein [Fibrobacteria bacterium]|nr:right-handed parallel beta-helix repeat-containing protein [Fibrobacteria bacterium]
MARNSRFSAPSAPFALGALAIALGGTPNLAATEVCGTFSLATEWATKDSPYLVTGDIFIPSTSRLRIGPGVIVRFAKPRPCLAEREVSGKEPPIAQVDWADSAYTGIKVEGTFYVLGSEEQPVLFEPETAKAGAVGWDGVRLTGQQAGAAEISFAVFRGANQAVTVDRAGFFIHHSLFEGNNTGLSAGLRGDVGVVNCNFIGNFSAGIVIRKGSPRIANNIFAGNRSYGIWADGRPAIQAWNNAFWENREEACFKCPYAILDAASRNANKDSCDRFGNLAADPVFIGSPSFDAAKEADVRGDTPAHLVKDPKLAQLEADARAEAEKAAKGKKKKKEYAPVGNGPYLLSKYSKLVDAGRPGRDFRDRDGSPNDIGMHGGPMGRMASDPF